MPYSVSIPRTFATDIVLEVLAGADVLDRSTAEDVGLFAIHEGADKDDPFALLSRHARPVVRVRGVGKVLVLAVHREFFGPTNDVFDHGATREVLEVQHLFVATLIRHFEESVLVGHAVHVRDGLFDHDLDGLGPVSPTEVAYRRLVDRQFGVQVALEDLRGGVGVGSFDLDLHVEAPRAKDGRVDQVLAVRGTDDDDVAQRLDAINLGEQLRDDRRLHVRADAGAASTKERVHLVKEDDHRHALFGLFTRALEDHADLTLGLTDVLVEEFRALDIEEVRAHVAIARQFGDLLGE